MDDGQGPVFIEEENDIRSNGTMAIVLSMASKLVMVYYHLSTYFLCFFLNFYLRLGFGSCLVHTKTLSAHKSKKEFCMYGVLNKVYLQNLFRNGYNFSRRI